MLLLRKIWDIKLLTIGGGEDAHIEFRRLLKKNAT